MIGAGLIVITPKLRRDRSLTGAVLVEDEDPRKQSPIKDATIILTDGSDEGTVRARSDAAGFFRLSWQRMPWRGQEMTLRFEHPDYSPLEVTKESLTDDLLIARLWPSPFAKKAPTDGSEIPVSNIRIRYGVKATNTASAGSITKTFDVINTGNQPCERKQTCSPDGRWKATVGGLELDAGESQEFQNVRVSCIAGPCPFTPIEKDGFSRGGRKINVAVRAWSDTVTFLVEAEVIRTMLLDTILQAYPSIFGRVMSFTMPPTGQGLSIEAEVQGVNIVFPLSPDLKLSWATCTAQSGVNNTKLYSCQLNVGYKFR